MLLTIEPTGPDAQQDQNAFDLGFVRGVLAGWGLVDPTDQQIRAAVGLLQAHYARGDAAVH